MLYLRFIVCWAWVGLPLGWGFYQSVQKSLPLFGIEATKPAATAPAAPAAPVAPAAPAAEPAAPAAK